MTKPSVVFIDFEASSLESDGWPIEVGLAWIAETEILSCGHLIRPECDWPEEAWSPASAEVHGIPRSALESAEPAPVVAAWTVATISGRTLVSDAPEFDQRWLNLLLDSGPDLDRPIIRDFDAIVARHFGPDAVGRVFTHLDRSRAHRAESDARILAEAWLAGSAPR